MQHYFRCKEGYVFNVGPNIYLSILNKRYNKLFLSKKLLWLIYITLIGASVWLHSTLLLLLVTIILGIYNLWGKYETIIIPVSTLKSIERTDNTISLNYYIDTGVSIKTIRKVYIKDFETLKDLL